MCYALCPPQDLFLKMVCRLYKHPSDETINGGSHVFMHVERLHTHVKILQSMPGCNGLWKHSNNPACSIAVTVFKMVEFNTIYNVKESL